MSRKATSGISLVEVALLLSLAGVVLATFVPAFHRHLRTSKIAEAPLELSRMHAALAAYYESPQAMEAGKRLRCLPPQAGPTPAKASSQPVALHFGAPDTPGSASWRAIGYEPSGSIRFRYSYLPVAAGCGVLPPVAEAAVTLRAEGDLDADGALSRFERTASARDGELVLDPLMAVHDRVE